MQIGVLALQGAFIEHEQMLSKLGISSFEIRQKSDLDRNFDGLIIPGGESTVQGKLMHELEMFDRIKEMIRENSESSDYDVVLVELGGTVGDIESNTFLEALRQIQYEQGSSNTFK